MILLLVTLALTIMRCDSKSQENHLKDESSERLALTGSVNLAPLKVTLLEDYALSFLQNDRTTLVSIDDPSLPMMQPKLECSPEIGALVSIDVNGRSQSFCLVKPASPEQINQTQILELIGKERLEFYRLKITELRELAGPPEAPVEMPLEEQICSSRRHKMFEHETMLINRKNFELPAIGGQNANASFCERVSIDENDPQFMRFGRLSQLFKSESDAKTWQIDLIYGTQNRDSREWFAFMRDLQRKSLEIAAPLVETPRE